KAATSMALSMRWPRSPSSRSRSRPRFSGPGRPPMQAPDELRAAFEEHLATVRLHPDLGGLEEAVRYATAGGGKRIRPVVCLATAEASGGSVQRALDAATALELVHTFSLVHDDLPSMDDDAERRGRPSTHVA